MTWHWELAAVLVVREVFAQGVSGCGCVTEWCCHPRCCCSISPAHWLCGLMLVQISVLCIVTLHYELPVGWWWSYKGVCHHYHTCVCICYWSSIVYFYAWAAVIFKCMYIFGKYRGLNCAATWCLIWHAVVIMMINGAVVAIFINWLLWDMEVLGVYSCCFHCCVCAIWSCKQSTGITTSSQWVGFM